MKNLVVLTFLLSVMVIGGVMTFRPKDSVIHFEQDVGMHAQQVGFKPDHPERGYVQNCGKGERYFNISWFPKDVSPTDEVRFFADVISPLDFEKGKVSAVITYEGNPMVSVDKYIRCEDIASLVAENIPSSAFKIDCPIKKGERLAGFYVFPNTQIVIGYDGDYELVATLTNEKGEKLCIKADATVNAFP